MASRPRVLLLTYEYPPVGGGMGKAARAIGRALTRRGFEVAVLTSRFRGQPRVERGDDGLLILRVPVLRKRINQANALEVLSFAASGKWNIWWTRRRFRPDVCVAFLTIPSGIVAEAMRWLGGPRWICLLRGQDVPGYPDTPRWMHTLAWPLTWFLWKRAAHVVANSEGLADLARESSPHMRVEIVPNGIDVERYKPGTGGRESGVGKKEREESGRMVRVLFTGRLVRFKGLRKLLRAWEEVARGNANAELWIAGYGPDRRMLEELAERRGIASRVKFLGRLEEEALIRALQSADVFVNPSEGEGMPNAVLEAMACELPVVLSDIGPHRELLVGGRGGVLCDATRPGEIAKALSGLVNDEAKRRRLGREAREVVREHFSWDQAVERLVALFPERMRKRLE